jgi:hypothetical protein
MNRVPVQNVISGPIVPFPMLALIVTCLVGDQQPFVLLTNASHANSNFAVIHFFWDRVLGTYRGPDTRQMEFHSKPGTFLLNKALLSEGR